MDNSDWRACVAVVIYKYIIGLTVPKLNQGKSKEIPIPLPPLAEQKKLVKILDETAIHIAKLTDIANQKLTELADLKQSYLHQAFTSELTTNPKSPTRNSVAGGV